MELIHYVTQCINDPKAGSADSLEITAETQATIAQGGIMAWLGLTSSTTRTGLLQKLIEVRDKSENTVLEHGCNLFYEGGGIRLGAVREGSKEGVPLDSAYFHDKPNYLGDFHVHPYSKKMSENASIGPSFADITGWFDYRPKGTNGFALFLVFAGKALCATVLRAKTRPVDDLKGNGVVKQLDFQKAIEYARKKLGPSYDEAVTIRQKLEQMGKAAESVTKERELWDRLPKYPGKFGAFNKEMNVGIANVLEYEYFVGEVTGAAPNQKCDMQLLSKRVH